jgi:hypothetical protein
MKVPWWLALVFGGLAFLGGVGVGSGTGAPPVSTEAADLEDERAELEAERAEVEGFAERLEDSAADLRARGRRLARREKALERVEERAAKRRVDDGIWSVGVDVEPGTYRAPAGPDCYWAILGSADSSDIDNNGGFTANQTVTLVAGKWFETANCGTWEKIG